MKYVKKDGVVKEVSDNLAGAYVAVGWKPADKVEYEKTVKSKPTPAMTYGSDTQ